MLIAFAKVLDKRLLKALGEMGFARPTLIQAQAIPIALEGRDVLARARTGSGKTAAYCIPVAQKILQAKIVRFLTFNGPHHTFTNDHFRLRRWTPTTLRRPVL